MITMSLGELASLLQTQTKEAAITFQGMSIDTRTLSAGNLFIALKGDRVDSHDYLEEAQQKGAVAAIVSRTMPCSLPQLCVADPTLALGKIGAFWRNQFEIPLIGVTGSSGKTTLKNMLAAIMTAACDGRAAEVLATRGNRNNALGLPLTLACLNHQHRYAVIEMGMNHFGEIEYLTRLTRPYVAVITNAAPCHLEGVGDIEGVARAKAEIFSGLSEKGIAILNRDDAFFTYWREAIGPRPFLSFGLHPDADLNATLISTEQNQQISLRSPSGTIDIHLPLLGFHNVQNALAASAAALAIGIDLRAIKKGLENITPEPRRLQVHTLANGVKIIDDSYNANPLSLSAAVKTLATFEGKKILVLGDMKELGQEAKSLHQQAGEQIRAAGIDYLFTYGDLSETTAQSFGEGAYHFNEQEKLVSALKPFLYNQTTILVKGSRSMQMDKVVTGLVQ